MREYFIRRLYQTIIVLFVVTSLLFLLFRIMPGDPTAMMVDQALDESAQQQLLKNWGLDAPLYKQYFIYFKNLLHFDFGLSFYYQKPVLKAIASTIWNTMVLMGTGLSFAIGIGIMLGTYLGWRRGSKRERFGLVLALVIRSTPIFWLGIIILMIFSYWLSLFPSGGMRKVGYSASNLFQIYFSLDFLYHMALPFLTALLYFMADPLMIMRTSMLEIKGEDFLGFLKSTGLSNIALQRHCARNALLPVVTFVAVMSGYIFGGVVLLEVIFGWPGMGREMVLSINRRDYPVAQASFLIMATMVITANFIVDIVIGYLDPRIKYA